MNEKNKKNIIYLHGNNARIDQSKTITPRYSTYVITDNETNKHGCVLNKADEDAELAKREVDANRK